MRINLTIINRRSKDQTLAFKLLAFSRRLVACVAGVRTGEVKGFLCARETRGAGGRREGNLPPRAPLSLPLRTSATQARRSDSGGGVKKSEKEKTA